MTTHDVVEMQERAYKASTNEAGRADALAKIRILLSTLDYSAQQISDYVAKLTLEKK